MPSNHLILCHPFLLFPSIFPSIRVSSRELALLIRWPQYWSFNFSISPSNEYSGWFPLGLTGLISLQSKGLSRVFSNTTVQKPSLWPNSHIHTWLPEKPWLWVYHGEKWKYFYFLLPGSHSQNISPITWPTPLLHGSPPPNKGSANFLIKYDPHQILTLPPIISWPLLLTLPLLFIAWSQVSPRCKFAFIYFSQSKSQSSRILKKRRKPSYKCGERTFQVGNVTEVKPWGWEDEGFYSVFSLVRCNCRKEGCNRKSQWKILPINVFELQTRRGKKKESHSAFYQ